MAPPGEPDFSGPFFLVRGQPAFVVGVNAVFLALGYFTHCGGSFAYFPQDVANDGRGIVLEREVQEVGVSEAAAHEVGVRGRR